MCIPALKEVPVVSGWTARRLLAAPEGPAVVSFDLGLSRSEVAVEKEVLRLPDGQTVEKTCLADSFSTPEDCVEISSGRARKVYLFSDQTRKYYKLYQPFEDRAPTIVINNASMHRIVGQDPWQDEQEKAAAILPCRGECLDTCCGLGYSAQILAAGGTPEVTTCEVDRNVLAVASVNPWSRGLFRSRAIRVELTDVRDFVAKCDSERFAAIFHDPPTVYQTGELYGAELYAQFRRILKSGGVLYHYVGAPGGRKNQDYARGVIRRLRCSGFCWAKRCVRGVLARVPG